MASGTLNYYASYLFEVDLKGLLDTLQVKFGSAEEVALHALSNAWLSTSYDEDGEAQHRQNHFEILHMLLVPIPVHPISNAILEADIVPFLLDTMSCIASAADNNPSETLNGQCTVLGLCIQLLVNVYMRPSDGRTWIREGFRHGQLEILFKMGRFFEHFDPNDRNCIAQMFSDAILPYMHLSAIFRPARRDMVRFSMNLNSSPFGFE